METRTKLNIRSTEQFPPLKQTVTKVLYNNMSDESSSDDESLPDLYNKGNTSDYESEEENKSEDIKTILRSHKNYKNITQQNNLDTKKNIPQYNQHRHQSQTKQAKDTNNKISTKKTQTRKEETIQVTIVIYYKNSDLNLINKMI